MNKSRILGLFSNFDEAFNVVADIRQYKVAGVFVEDVTVISPVEHPDIEEVLGERFSPVPYCTIAGAITGIVFGFLFLAASEANFLVQPQGGKAVIPIPSNIVLNYEMMILFSVVFTITGFMIGARLFRKRKSLYSEKVGIDQVGIELEIEEKFLEPIKELFNKHQALEIRDEIIK